MIKTETLLDIAENINTARPVFKKYSLQALAGRVHGIFDSKEDTYWFTINDSMSSRYGKDDLIALGVIVPRNSDIATRIFSQEKLAIEIPYQTKLKSKRVVNHCIIVENKADFGNREISMFDDKQKYIYRDIASFLNDLRAKQREIEENERKQREQEAKIELLKKQAETAHQRSVLTKGLNKLQEEHRILTMQQEEMGNLTRYIRQQGKLRFTPIVDPIQTRIKTEHLYDGVSVIINGGPGTGKTTTMIQRLKYLTDIYAINEDFEQGIGRYSLTNIQKDNLLNAINGQRDWMFFSPSALLKEYLSDAMNREGLTNTNAKVWHWDEYRTKIIRENYRFIDPTNENSPFKAGRNKDNLFVDYLSVIMKLKTFYLNDLKAINRRFPKLDENTAPYKWKTIAINIQKRFVDVDNYDIPQFVQLFKSLEDVYAKDCRELLAENRETIRKISDDIHALASDDEELMSKLEDLLTPTVTEQADDVEEEVDAVEEDLTDKITQMIRNWFKRYCYSKKNADIKLTKRQETLSELLLPLLMDEHKEKISRVGELALFEQFAKYTRGIASLMFGGFAGKYKRFRRQALRQKDGNWNTTVLKSLVERREGKDLHPQEQSLIIGFLNNLTKVILEKTGAKVNHYFVDAYRELSRPIIGIDEATDFSECDIYAMESLLSQDYSSLTICGDMMQRLTAFGVKSWDNMCKLVKNPLIVDMATSYRQSYNLLNVAKSLYYDTIGEEPNYKPYMKSQKVPKPIACISDDEDDKIAWIEKRINEVYTAYGKRLPSIAIFLNDKNQIPAFVEKLEDTDFIYDAGIKVVDGSDGNVLASSNQIRVYPINVVKGMEFDVVFFHNIDNSNDTTDLIKRYIYVGVSRAAFFLGVTLSQDNPELTQYFEVGKDWKKL